MRRMAAIVWALASASAANASDRLALAPPASWVVPVAVPDASTKGDTTAVQLLLSDQQVDLQPETQTSYSETAYRIQTPQGLPAGAVSFAWNPDLQSVTVHKLLVRRGARVIDVLASGQKFTIVRRESNLENAVLDGQLTATIQPEGLQVGDIIDFSVSIANHDPALGRHVEQFAAAWNGFPLVRAHLHAQWPTAVPVRLRATGGLVLPKLQHRGSLTSFDITMDDVQPINPPKGAPARFARGRIIEASDFHSWSEAAALISPLFAKAAELSADDPLNAEIERIRSASADPVMRATAALALVQERVRYVALLLNNGGLVPAPAGTTWSRRYGDCKGKTALLLALLHRLNIEAEPVLVSARAGDGLDARLPMIEIFDHVLVRAHIAGRAYWLDGTRTGDRRLDKIMVPDFTWGLPLIPGAQLVGMVPPPLDDPSPDIAISLDATAGLALPAKAHVDYIVRGDQATVTNLELSNLTGDTRERAIKAFWKDQFDFIEPTATTSGYDADAHVLTLTMTGDAKLEWKDGYYDTDNVGVGFKADFARDAGFDRDAPYAVGYPRYSRTRETISLPAGNRFSIYKDLKDVDTTVAGVVYRRHNEIVGNRFFVEATQRALVPEFSAAEAPAAQIKLRELAKQELYIAKPETYHPTDQELTESLKTKLQSVDELIVRGNQLLDRERFTEARSDFDKALSLAPQNVLALADRAIVNVDLKNIDAAQRDIDAASAIDPRHLVVWRARGMLAHAKHDYKAEIAAFTKALEIDPRDEFSLHSRALAYRGADQNEAALADTAAVLLLNPTASRMQLLRATILRGKGDKDGVATVAAAAVAANPNDRYSLVLAAKLYAAINRQSEVSAMFDRALKLGPEAWIYINRADARPKSDSVGKLSDLDAALKLDPKNIDALEARSMVQSDQGDFAGAAATLTTIMVAKPSEPWPRLQRGIVYIKAGQTNLGTEDLAAARRLAKTADAFSNLCSRKAISGVDLLGALADCDAGLALEPDSVPILDSRGFVLFRLGRFAEAAASYDRSLRARPGGAHSLYGRALVAAKQGDQATADRDRAEAIKVSPGVVEEFESYGIAFAGKPSAGPKKAD